MATCSHCGQEIPRLWRQLRVTDKGDIYWDGIRQPRVAPLWSKILFVLAHNGQAASETLQLVGSEGFDANNHGVQISRIRKWLAGQGIPLRIVSRYGFGYALELAE